MSVAAIQSVIDLVGETVTLRREPATDVVVKAKIINYEPTELAGNIIQGRATARISVSELAATGWIGPPEQGDKILRGSGPKTMHIESSEERNWFEDGAVHILQLRG